MENPDSIRITMVHPVTNVHFLQIQKAVADRGRAVPQAPLIPELKVIDA
jgi:hypothetical protein